MSTLTLSTPVLRIQAGRRAHAGASPAKAVTRALRSTVQHVLFAPQVLVALPVILALRIANGRAHG